MKEDLRKSLDTMLMFERLIGTFRKVVQEELTDIKGINDELTVTMMVAHNGLGRVLVELHKVREIIDNRMMWFGDGIKGGDGIGLKKQLIASFMNDGEEDFGDTYDQPYDEEGLPPYEYPEDFDSEYDVGDDDDEPE